MSTYNCKRSINGIIVQNNPVNWIDPNGEYAVPVVILGEVVIIAAAWYIAKAIGKGIEKLKDLLDDDCPGTRQGDLPAKAEPNSTRAKDNADGTGQIRDYGEDGRATTDYDFGHDHGAGDPHAHDWDWTQTPPRQPGRSLK